MTTIASLGVVAALLAVWSMWADRRRMRRSNPDAVGFMPWTAVFFVSMFVACVALGLAARAWATG
ncbi:hypothetical protein [Novosphingobium lentum]|uniref:hypothetical protein n=1 Tax=Novosphingobium lentum TaxID=145287 RepID=UPI003F70D370